MIVTGDQLRSYYELSGYVADPDAQFIGRWEGERLLGVVAFSVLMQLGIHYVPAAQVVFDVGPLSAADCVLTLLVALGPVTVIELSKLVRRWRAPSAAA